MFNTTQYIVFYYNALHQTKLVAHVSLVTYLLLFNYNLIQIICLDTRIL